MILVSLVGEQAIPNLVPIRYLKPDENLLVHTDNENASVKPARRLQNLIRSDSEVLTFKVDAFRVDKIRDALAEKLSGKKEVVFNLTGGTKPMSLAIQELARELNAVCIYYQTEGQRGYDQQSVLYFYRFDLQKNMIFDRRETLPSQGLLTLDDYLMAHLVGYEEVTLKEGQSGYEFEKAVLVAIQNNVDEYKANIKPLGVKNQLEIDLLIRRGNNVAVLEIKSGGEGSSKKALDQLTTIAAREYLGTYAVRILVTRGDVDSRSGWYKALAQSLRVNVIEFSKGLVGGRLDSQDAYNLNQRLAELLPLPRV